MIHIEKKGDCCGCSACVQKCPKQCISLVEDGEGFLYPKVDAAGCIDCGLCEKVCPWINRPEKFPTKEVLAVKNRNETERMASSSGGVFIALAREVIGRGGVVFGAVFDEKWEVKHACAETMEDVRPMMGSKYVQPSQGLSQPSVGGLSLPWRAESRRMAAVPGRDLLFRPKGGRWKKYSSVLLPKSHARDNGYRI